MKSQKVPRCRTRSRPGPCSVANGDCVAPIEGGYDGTARRTWCSCYECGEPVCSAPCCSAVIVERGRRRFCYNCRPSWWPEEPNA